MADSMAMRSIPGSAGSRPWSVRSLLGALGLAWLLAAGSAHAIRSIQVTPASVPVPTTLATAGTALTFVWTVTPAPGPDRTIASPGGAFVLEGGGRTTLLGTGPLAPVVARRGRPVSFTETVELPSTLVAAALERGGAQRLLYLRPFEATYSMTELVWDPFIGAPAPERRNATTRAEAAAVLSLVGPTGGPLRVFRAQIHFDDGTPVRVLSQRSALRALVDLSYTGGGTIQGTWELASPTSSAGEPIFVPLMQVRRFLGAGQRVTVESPPLPTHQTGLYFVRFRVESPEDGAEDPVIRYHVTAAGGAPVTLAASGPTAGAVLDAAVVFGWPRLRNAVEYRLEFFEHEALDAEGVPLFTEEGQVFRDVRSPGGKPLPYEAGSATEGLSAPVVLAERSDPAVGLIVPSEVTETPPTDLLLRRVEPGRTYLWQVRAMAADGSTIGASRPQVVRVPSTPATTTEP